MAHERCGMVGFNNPAGVSGHLLPGCGAERGFVCATAAPSAARRGPGMLKPVSSRVAPCRIRRARAGSERMDGLRSRS